MPKLTKKGRSAYGPPFIQLHHYLVDSQAWLSLKPAERAAYLALARIYNGTNNGFLACSVRDLAERCLINKDTASKSLARLEELGFIELRTPGGFSRKTPHASEWRLTNFRCDRTGEAPTKAFLKRHLQIQNAVRKEGRSGPE